MKAMVNVKDIITVCDNWTKGNVYYYLVTFADEYSNFVNGIRIMFGGKEYTGNGIFIPEMGMPVAHANVFTGFCAIRRSDIQAVLRQVSDDTYDKICSSVLSVMKGEYEYGPNGQYLLDEASIPAQNTYSDLENVVSRLEKIYEAASKLTVEKQKESTVMIETIEKEVIEPSGPVEVVEEVDSVIDVVIDEKQIEESFKKSSSQSIDKIIQLYNQSINKVDWIFENFTDTDGMIVPEYVYRILVLKKDTKIYSSSIVLSKNDLLYLYHDGNRIIDGSVELLCRDGIKKKLSKASIKSLVSHIKHLVNGTQPKNITRYVIDAETERDVLEDRKNGLTFNELINKYDITYSVLQKILGKKTKSSKSRYVQIITGIKNRIYIAPQEFQKDIIEAAQYCFDNIEIISIISSKGYIPEKYDGNLDIFRLVALRFKNISNTLNTVIEASELIQMLGIKVLKVLFGNNTSTYRLLYAVDIINNRDSISLDVKPEDIVNMRDIVYVNINKLLTSITGMYSIEMVNKYDELKNSPVVNFLRTIGIPDNWILYYANKKKVNKV